MNCTRKIEFDAGHRVLGHAGKCRFPHGHRYVLEVTASSQRLNTLGMVMDFGEIKSIIGEWVARVIDHGFLVYEKDRELLSLLNALSESKVCVVGFNPTAENLSEWLLAKCDELLGKETEVSHVRLYETPNCWADAYKA